MSESTEARTRAKERFATLLLEWYRQHRRDLPWRQVRDPYSIWVSEMMLQQTQVATVLPYWTRWMERFPTVTALAQAPLEDVLKQWQGLGYYARARNLHRAAQLIQEKYEGKFPGSFEEVLALPGVGRYTAGAVCSIALGMDVPIVDANVIRVLCRVFGLHGDPRGARVQEQLWELAGQLIPPGNASEFNQAMMELGALVCQAKPDCARCPQQTICLAYASGNPSALPEFAPRPAFTTQTDASALLAHPRQTERFLLARRPEGGLWGGLWELPRVTTEPEETAEQAAVRALHEVAGLEAEAVSAPVARVRHGVTTRKITLVAVPCRLVSESVSDGLIRERVTPLSPPETRPATGFSLAWVTLAEMETLALSSPQAKLLARLNARTEQPVLF